MFVGPYTLDGKPLSTRHSTGMLAATTVGRAGSDTGRQREGICRELWRTPIPVGDQRYFDGMLYLMSMLHCSGNFRIWGANAAGGGRPQRTISASQKKERLSWNQTTTRT